MVKRHVGIVAQRRRSQDACPVRSAHSGSSGADRRAASIQARPRPVRPARHRHGSTPSTRWAMAEASAVKKRVSKRRTRPGGVIARAIRKRPDGSGSRPASANGFHGPSSSALRLPLLRPGKGRSPRRLRGWRRPPASARATAVILGLPFKQVGFQRLRNRGRHRHAAVSCIDAAAGKDEFAGHEHHLVVASADQHFWHCAGAIDQDQRGGIDGTAIGVMVGFLSRSFRSRSSRPEAPCLPDQRKRSMAPGLASSNPCIRNAHCTPTTAPLTGCNNSSEATKVNGR